MKKMTQFEIFEQIDWNILKEALKTEHFLNVLRARIRSEYFPQKHSSNMTKFMNIWR